MEPSDRGENARRVFSENLLQLLEERQMVQADLAAALGLTPSTISDWCTGKKYPRVNSLQLLADFFGIPRSRLTEGEMLPGTPYHPTRRIPILGRVAAGLPLFAQEQVEGYTYTDFGDDAEYFALRVEGNSMNAARIYDGDILIVRRQDIVENGEIAVVLTDEESATVKRFYRQGNTVTLLPQSTDASYGPQIYDLARTQIRF